MRLASKTRCCAMRSKRGWRRSRRVESIRKSSINGGKAPPWLISSQSTTLDSKANRIMAHQPSSLADSGSSMSTKKTGASNCEGFVVVPLRHPGRWLSAALMLYVILTIADLLITNPRWLWNTVWEYLFSGPVLTGVGNTLFLTVLAEIVGVSFGILLAIMRLS